MISATIKVKSPARLLNKAGKERRSMAKNMQLAICYGMSAASAGARMNKSAEEGKALMDSFFVSFPKVKELIEASKAFLYEKGYVEDWAGRRRHLPDLRLPAYEVILKYSNDLSNFNPFFGCADRQVEDPKILKWQQKVQEQINKSQEWQRKKAEKEGRTWEDNGEMSSASFKKLAAEAEADGIKIIANTARKAQAERQCLNSRIQGGAGTLTKLAMVNIFNSEEMKKCQAELIITVHDEVLVECPAFYADQVEQILPKIMIDTAKPYLNVNMKCDPYNVTRWYGDEYAVAIQDEFKKLEKGDIEKGIEPMSREESLKTVLQNHSEIPEESIIRTIETGCDLEF